MQASLPSLQIIYRDAVCTLSYDPEVPCSHMVWHGFASSTDFRAACMRALELVSEKRLTKGLSDARHLRVISVADQEWFTNDYLPMALALNLGPSYSAVIVPHDFFGKQSLDSLRGGVEDKLAHETDVEATTRYFDNEAAAREWLMSVGEPRAASGVKEAESTSAAAATEPA